MTVWGEEVLVEDSEHQGCVAPFNKLFENGLVHLQLFKLCSCALLEDLDDCNDLLLRRLYFSLLLVAPDGNLLQIFAEDHIICVF